MSSSENRLYCRLCKSCHERDKLVTVPLSHVTREVKVPLLIIQDLQQRNVVQNPLTCGDVDSLRWYGVVLEAFDGDYKPPSHNLRTLQHRSLLKDYQRWIYEHYIYDRSGEKIYVRAVAREAAAIHKILNNKALHDEIRIIRIVVYGDRRKARETGRTVEDIATERFSQQELDFDDDDQ